jgi:hypothetical protein
MRSGKVIIMAMLLVISVAMDAFASFSPAAPGKSEPQGLRWKGRTIKIAVSSSILEPNINIKTDSDVRGAINRSVLSWQNVADIEIQVELSDKLSISPPGLSGDGVSLLTIAQSAENVLLFSKDPLAESAKTRVFYNRKNFITEADIVLNPFQQFSTDGTFGTFDLESTLTHEIGHLLGLRHSGVLGATMSDSLARNGTFGLADLAARSLAENDIAAIRELYGVNRESETCCGAIAGKLTAAMPKAVRGIRVWAEESDTGRVAAQGDTGSDGSFRLGGLSGGTYTVFWQKDGDLAPSSVGGLGTFKIEKDETRTINEKISLTRSDVILSYVGVNSQLTDSAVTLNTDREYMIYLGGKNLDRRKITIEFNSPFITVAPNSLADQDFGDGVSVINFVVTVHADTPRGVYSIFATGGQGSMSSLIGALNVQ